MEKNTVKKKRHSPLRWFLTAAGALLLLIALLALGFTVFTRIMRDDSLSDIRGVNLGSWLVLERWMTPEVFEGTDAADEYTLARAIPAEDYAARIEKHRSTFITEEDFAFLADQDVNLVRIPIPYYIFGDRTDEPYIACIDELDRAFDWAEKYGMQILIDMHMVPGSQNGFDNGGISGVCVWAQHPEEVDYVLDVLERLAVRYGERPGLFGIQPLNEPLVSSQEWEDMDVMERYPPVDKELAEQSAPLSMDFLKSYYLKAYDRLRPLLPDDKWIVYHDAFQMWSWLTFMNDGEYQGVAFDTHVYLFNVESVGLKSPFWHRAFVWGNGLLMEALQTRFPVICGEWSLFNNYSYEVDDSGELSDYYSDIAQYQLETWEKKGAGSIYWNYRLGDGQTGKNMEAWDFRKCVESGWLDFRKPSEG
ncbi:glycoside hydrolase family 5 protein [Lachnoclostridium sp. An169]|uniref:glycoside hydrolase family 5 protein n=1 Tax=Lachnoclostridium sp. An169 TaxID=1965569 RepID=UPI001FA9245F|nr:cellulase family glycosylhydrolase [Lachnoclostridium sp. An169]